MKKIEILVINNSASDRLVIKKVLKEYDILCASDGVEAVQLINQHNEIDLILLDLNMPNDEGFEILETIKSNDGFKKARIIVLTDYDEIEKEVKGLKLGAIDYIRKPIHMESVKARIDINIQLLKAQKFLELKFKEQSFTFDAIFYEAPIGIAIAFTHELLSSEINTALRINPMFESITGYSKEELSALGWARITHPDDLDEEIAKILNSIIGMEVKIEIIGYWIWVSGDTFNYKEYLKELRFRWSSNKKSWYKSMIDTGYRRFSKYKNMEDLRNNFNVIEIKTKKKAKISA